MTNDLSLLSERERAVLRLVATGATNQQIADQLDISPNTVKVHLRNIFGKIGAASRTEATMYAVRTGLVDVPNGATAHSVAATVAVAPPADFVAPLPPPSAEAEPSPEPTEPPVLEIAPAPEPLITPINQLGESSSTIDSSGQPLSRRLVAILGVLVGIALSVAVLILWQQLLVSSDPPRTEPAATAPINGNWVERKAPGQAITGAAAINYGPIFVVGGWDGQKVLDSTLRYDPLTDSWAELTNKPTPTRDIQATVLGGKIFVPGGKLADGTISNVLEIFDPESKGWSSGPTLPAPRSAYGLAVIEGRLYLFGGWDGAEYRAEVFRLNPGADEWETLTPMPTARAYSCVATSPEGNVFVIGGENNAGALYTNEVYTPASEGTQDARPWSQRKPLDQPRSRTGCGAVDNEIYLFGGEAEQTTLRYDLRTDKWQELSAPATAIGTQPAVAYRDGLFYVVGGGSEAEPIDQLYGFAVRYSITVPVQ